MFDMIAFDADDTLWHNEILYSNAQAKFRGILANFSSPERIDQKLLQTELRNIEYFGYGIKSFTLSMIETAVELSEGRIRGKEIKKIINLGKEMLSARIELLDHVEEVLSRLSKSHELMIITKGDLLDQQSKLARSGLEGYFKHIEIVSEKDEKSYAELLARHHIDPKQFLMVGNSLRSDVLPVLAIGGRAVHIPHPLTWAYENSDDPLLDEKDYLEIEHIGLLPDLVEELSNQQQ